MHRSVPLLALLSLFFGLFTTGCDKETAQVETTQAVKPAATLRAELLPLNPRVGNCVEVLLEQSSGRVAFAWSINGQPVENQTNSLCDERLKKGTLVEVDVSDNNGSERLQTVFTNTPPRIVRLAQESSEMAAGKPLTIVLATIDPDQDEISYTCRWFVNDNEVYDVTETTLPGDRFIGGDTIRVEVIPSDGQDEGSLFRSTLISIPNAPPRFLSKPPTEIQGTTLTYTAVAEDPDGGRIVYSLDKAPPGMTIDAASGYLVWEVPADWSGLAQVEVVAEDSYGERFVQRFNLDISRK